MITVFASLFAYLWIYICLSVWTPGVVTIPEALLTLSFSFILIITAYLADRTHECIKRKKEGPKDITAREGYLDIDDFVEVIAVKKKDLGNDRAKMIKHDSV